MNKTDSIQPDPFVELESLLELFYSAADVPGSFDRVDRSALPDLPASLLAHDHHMTVTLESHHGCPVNVQVLESRIDEDRYSRKILLTRQADDAIVMFGIVRLDRTVLADDVREEIESQRTPLGRVLIEHGVLRAVKLVNLFRIEASGELADLFGIDAGSIVYGRTAMIYCDGDPAIELLEIAKI